MQLFADDLAFLCRELQLEKPVVIAFLGEKQPGGRLRLGARRGNTEPFLMRADVR